MRVARRGFLLVALTLFAPILVNSVEAFALLGPYPEWMQVTNGFRQSGDIGGPMNIGEGYRWNVPVVTYGFDTSFLDYFGSNGVAAVEAALGTLNDLPDASSLLPTNFPANSTHQNYDAESRNLFDLKSAALAALVQQVGLAPPTRSIFILRRSDPSLIAYGYVGSVNLPLGPEGNYILARDFDPESLAPTDFVNGSPYTGFVYYQGPSFADVVETVIDPLGSQYDAVADNNIFFPPLLPAAQFSAGLYYTGLTYDDVGGLSYLLRTNNVKFETLLPNVSASGNGPWVNGALRPGVGKITFVAHPFDSAQGRFLIITNRFFDHYIVNNTVLQQSLERVISEPDLLFRAGDTGGSARFFLSTGTGAWINNADQNGLPGEPGPGTITPPISITFNKLGRIVFSSDPSPKDGYAFDQRWASFDQSTNAAMVYPDPNSETSHSLTVRLRLYPSSLPGYTWQLPMPIGSAVLLQSSTNLVEWTSAGSVTNDGSIAEWEHLTAMPFHRFFRVVPQ